ncbi:unnamed protein product [Ilex paraguariensis]
MDWQDQQCGRMEEIHQQLRSAYYQFTSISSKQCKAAHPSHCESEDGDGVQDLEDKAPGEKSTIVQETQVERLHLEIEELNVK